MEHRVTLRAKKSVMYSVIAVLGAVVFVIVYMRGSSDSAEGQGRFAAAVRESRQLLKSTSTGSVATAIASGLSECPAVSTVPEISPTDAQIAEIRRLTGEYLLARFDPDPRAYIEWQRSQGNQPATTAAELEQWRVEGDPVLALAEKPLSQQDEIDAIYLRLVDGIEKSGQKRWTVAALSTDPVGWTIDFTIPSKESPDAAGRDLSSPGVAVSVSDRIYGMKPWWKHPDVPARLAHATFANVCVVAELVNGERRPLAIGWCYSPKADRWLFVGLSIGQQKSDPPAPLPN